MIKRPDDEKKVQVSEAPVVKKKPSVKVPMNNAVSQGVKDVLTERAGVNVIDKKKIEKPHFLVIGAGAAFLVVSLIISGIIGSGRANKIGAVESEIGRYQNQIAIQKTAGTAQSKSEAERNSVGLDNALMAHDSQLIGDTLESMLNWTLDEGMERTYRNIQGIYHLPDNSSVTDTFYKGSYAASSFYADSGLIVYCTNPISHLRKYACEVTWNVTLNSGETVEKSALFICSVSSINDNGTMRDALSELEAYEVYSDEDYSYMGALPDDHSNDGMAGEELESDTEELGEQDAELESEQDLESLGLENQEVAGDGIPIGMSFN